MLNKLDKLQIGDKVKVIHVFEGRNMRYDFIQRIIDNNYECKIIEIDSDESPHNKMHIKVDCSCGQIWLYDCEFEFVNKHKLSDILKDNVSISCAGLDYNYITYKNGEFITNTDEKYILTLDDLTCIKWFEVEEKYKTNYEFKHEDRYYYVDKDASIDYLNL